VILYLILLLLLLLLLLTLVAPAPHPLPLLLLLLLLPLQLMVAVVHLAAHILLAVSLMLLLELGVEVCIKYESLGSEGMHSLYRWFTEYEDRHFPDPNRLRDKAHTWSLGLYPGGLKYVMALFDLPEAIAVARTAVCKAGGFHALSRLQVRLSLFRV
jgi:hypothetical protein